LAAVCRPVTTGGHAAEKTAKPSCRLSSLGQSFRHQGFIMRHLLWVGALVVLVGAAGTEVFGQTTKKAQKPTTAPATTRASPTPAKGVASKDAAEPEAKYKKATPAEAAKAMVEARAEAAEVAKTLGIKFKEIETDHYLVFTDWDPREYEFIKTNVEAAYAAVTRQFDIPVKENVYLGKLSCFMFSTHESFAAFANKVDRDPSSADAAGYYSYKYTGKRSIRGYMVMSKLDERYTLGNVNTAKRMWGYVLTHELTHSFVQRYISDRDMPSWLNEGIAEVVGSSCFPRDVKADARKMALQEKSFSALFKDDAGNQKAEMYPVMRTLVETLILKDRKAFLHFFDDIKKGATTAESLQTNYKWTFDDLEKYWRRYVGQ